MESALSHPRLLDCRRLFLRNFTLDVNIGIHEFEKNGAQRVVINVDLFVPLAQSTPQADKIHEVVDYDLIRKTIKQRTDRGHINLQETLCDEIATALLAHPAVRAVRVSTEKPDVYPDCEAVGVEIFRFRDA
jgi:dihydroneopterin aldolase